MENEKAILRSGLAAVRDLYTVSNAMFEGLVRLQGAGGRLGLEYQDWACSVGSGNLFRTLDGVRLYLESVFGGAQGSADSVGDLCLYRCEDVPSDLDGIRELSAWAMNRAVGALSGIDRAIDGREVNSTISSLWLLLFKMSDYFRECSDRIGNFRIV